MRELATYSARDWLVGTPLAHGFRRARNLLVDRIYRRRAAAGQAELVARLRAEAPPVLAVTVAFNLPEAVELLADALARFVPGARLLVCDNSSDPKARTAIAALCAARDLPYCPLPPSPFKGGRNGSRSHAVALNWIWENLIRPARPKVVALLDHDLVPLAPTDLAALVAEQPCYGMVRYGTRYGGWFLWPGYSVFDFAKVAALPLDFGTDTPRTLDTGGQNWRVLYRHLDLDRLRWAETHTVYLEDPATGAREPCLLADGWLHVGGAGHRVGGASALALVRDAFRADPDGFIARLMATAVRNRPGRPVA